MKMCFVIGLIFLAVFCEGMKIEPQEEKPKEELSRDAGKCPYSGHDSSQAFSDANLKFAFDLYKIFKKSADKNIFFSAGSLSLALGMVLLGTKGKTSEELGKAMHWEPGNFLQFHDAVKSLLLRMNQMSSTTNNMFKIANRIWVQDGFPVRNEFMNLAQLYYLASAKSVDFNDSLQTRDIINDWVNDTTNGKVEEILPAYAISSNTKLVLTNALYFKGIWKIPFEKNKTFEAEFHISETETVLVDMMTVKGEFGYSSCSNLDSEMVELLYEGEELSMIIILPYTSIEETDKLLNLKDFNDCVNVLRTKKRNLTINLPQFEVQGTFEMKKVLQDLGVKDLFVGGKADFTGLVDPPASDGLFVYEIYHQAFIKVDEIGTEAGAGTGVVIGKGMPFNVNRPFTFSIHERKNDFIFLGGRVVNPLADQ